MNRPLTVLPEHRVKEHTGGHITLNISVSSEDVLGVLHGDKDANKRFYEPIDLYNLMEGDRVSYREKEYTIVSLTRVIIPENYDVGYSLVLGHVV